MFGSRLDFLMNLTKTTNSALAMQLSMSPSYISRLRGGKRKLPKDAEFLLPLSQYMARKIVNDDQKSMLLRMLKIEGVYPTNFERQTELIMQWLTFEIDDYSQIASFVSGYGRYDVIIDNDISDKKALTEKEFYYGVEGRKEAIGQLFNMALSQEPGEILLYCNENTDWLCKDYVATNTMMEVWESLVQRGWKFKIIYPINIDINDLINQFYAFLPIVVKGAVERYYCSRGSASVCRRTLCIVSDWAAFSCTSIDNMVEDMPVILTQDKKAVRAYKKEFENYLNLCMPLGAEHTAPFYKQIWKDFRRFNDEQSDLIMCTRSVSAFTIPDCIVEKVAKDVDNLHFYNTFLMRKESLLEYMKKHNVYELITLPDIDDLFAGKVAFTFDDLVSSGSAFYTPQDFLEHLKALLEAIEQYPKYHVGTAPGYVKGFSLCLKENYGYFIVGHNKPIKLFQVNERFMVTALWTLFMHLILADRDIKRQSTIEKIKEYIKEIECRLKNKE